MVAFAHSLISSMIVTCKSVSRNTKFQHFFLVVSMNFQQPIDIYCERLSVGLLAEPVNLVSNAGFLIAAVFLDYRQRKLLSTRNKAISFLCLLLFVIGLGSGLFHSFANRWSALCDVVPIVLFVFSFTWLWVKEVSRMTQSKYKPLFPALSCLVLLVLALIFSLGNLGLPLNGSQPYLSVTIVLIALGGIEYKVLHRRLLLVSGCLFLVSLTARILDSKVCSSFSIGTHFVWHILNAIVAAMAIYSLLRLVSEREKLRAS